MKRRFFVLLFFVFVFTAAKQSYSATKMNIHWTPDTSSGTISHGTEVSGNIWMNVVNTDSNQMTTDTMTVTSAWYKENAHGASQIPLSLSSTSTSCSSCAVTGGAAKSIDQSVIFSLAHNAEYSFHAEGTVRHTLMMPPYTYTDETFNITTAVTANNLYFTSSPNDIIAWDPALMNSVSISSAWDDEQSGTCSLTYNIYSTGGGLVYTKQFTNQSRPGNSSWSWDGKDTQGATVEKGLYTVKATVTSNIPTVSSDCNRSSYLEIMRENYEAEFAGYDDNSTPNDESDDSYLYYIKSYKLKDTNNSDASSGTIKLYDPDLSNVMTWDIEDLPCVLHSNQTDGLETSATGLPHELLVSVPVDVMEEEYDGEIWRFVVHAEDDNADMYKTHANKPAIDMNEKVIYKKGYDFDCISEDNDAVDIICRFPQKFPYYGVDGNGDPLPAKGYIAYNKGSQSASVILDKLKMSRVFSFHGHGKWFNNEIKGGGAILCNNASYLVAQRCGDSSCLCANETLITINDNLSECKVALIQSCWSANDSDHHGNLARRFNDRGVTAAVGFTEIIDGSSISNFGPEVWFADAFWKTLCRSYDVDANNDQVSDFPDAEPQTVATAMQKGALNIYTITDGNYYGYNSITCYGNSSTKVIPY